MGFMPWYAHTRHNFNDWIEPGAIAWSTDPLSQHEHLFIYELPSLYSLAVHLGFLLELTSISNAKYRTITNQLWIYIKFGFYLVHVCIALPLHRIIVPVHHSDYICNDRVDFTKMMKPLFLKSVQQLGLRHIMSLHSSPMDICTYWEMGQTIWRTDWKLASLVIATTHWMKVGRAGREAVKRVVLSITMGVHRVFRLRLQSGIFWADNVSWPQFSLLAIPMVLVGARQDSEGGAWEFRHA